MSDQIILDLTTTEIVACYNNLSKVEVKKFKDRKTAESRLHSLVFNDPKKLLKAMRATKVRSNMIEKFERELQEDADKAAKQQEQREAKQKQAEAKATESKSTKEAKAAKAVKTPTAAAAADPDFAAAAKQLLESQAVQKAQEVAEAGNGSKAKRKNGVQMDMDLVALWFIQDTIKKQEAKNEEDVTTSAVIAGHIKETAKVCCKLLDKLAELKYITIEDDTVEPDEPFYYISLTKKGAEIILPNDQPEIITALPRAPKGERQPREPKGERAPRAPRGDKAGKKIYRLTKDNPRREGSIGWKSFNLITDGMTYEDYIKAGGRPGDVQWDLEHGFIELR